MFCLCGPMYISIKLNRRCESVCMYVCMYVYVRIQSFILIHYYIVCMYAPGKRSSVSSSCWTRNRLRNKEGKSSMLHEIVFSSTLSQQYIHTYIHVQVSIYIYTHVSSLCAGKKKQNITSQKYCIMFRK